MVIALARVLGSRQWNRGFTLIELLIVILIVGILAAVATPLYLGYIRDAKTAEAKAVAGSLWTAIQSNAIATCGNASAVSQGYPKAGLPGGVTNPARWSVAGGGNTLTVACATGVYTVNQVQLFTISGAGAADVDFVRVRFDYTAGNNPPGQMQCSTDSGANWVPC